MDTDKLKALWYDINKYGEYLEKETYNPYDKVQEFARRLKDIIEDSAEEVSMPQDGELCTPEEYFDEWFAYSAPEDKTFRMCFEEGIKYAELRNETTTKS